jgi:tetratricopeptide (TPR) repeat protein
MMVLTPDALIKQGYQARRERRADEARHCFAEAVDLCREGNDRVLLAQALTGLGQIERDLHHGDTALKSYEEAADLYRTVDEPLRLAHTVRHVGDILQENGQFQPALPCYGEALEIYRRHKETPPLDLANALRGFALLKGELGNPQEAKQLWQEAKNLYALVEVQAGVDESEAQIHRLTPQ